MASDIARHGSIVTTVLTVLCGVVLLVIATPLRAQEDIDSEEPIPSSVEEIVAPMDKMGEVKPLRPGFFPWLKAKLKDSPPFLRDTRLDLSLRSYSMRRTNYKYDGSINEAWAMGGALTYTSGWLYDRFSAGAALYTSQPVSAPDGHGGTDLLATGQKGFTALGQLYGRLRLFEGTFANLYRYAEFNSPYLSKNDSKMAPYSFEGYTVQGLLKSGDANLVYGGGYVAKIKPKTSEGFVWMSEKAGATAQRGVFALGARYSLGGFSLGAIDYYSDDIINIGYAEAGYTVKFENGFGLRFGAQFTDQRSTGSSLLAGTSFSTNQVGVKTDISYRYGILSLSYTTNSSGYNLQNPWSGYPGYTSTMNTDFKKAGTSAFGTKLSYTFTRLGLESVAAYLLFTHGWGMVDQTTKQPLPNENELDLDLQWRPTWRYLNGLWVRGRYGITHQYEGPKQYTHDTRVIIYYDIPLM